jgi:hypothetical protein
MAAVSYSSSLHLQTHHNHVVELIRCEAGGGSGAVSWRSEHQVWAGDGARIKLWDLRNLQRSVTEYQPDGTAVHSLCAAREGLIGGTLLGAYGMAFMPDGVVVPLTSISSASRLAGASTGHPLTGSSTVRPLPGASTAVRHAWPGRCTSVAVANDASTDVDTSLVVSTFEEELVGPGFDCTAGGVCAALHEVGIVGRAGNTNHRTWRGGGQFLSYVDSAARCKGCAVRLTGTTDGSVLFLSGDAVTGSLRLWDVGSSHLEGRRPGALPLLFIGDAGQQGTVRNMAAAMMPQDKLGVACVRALGQSAPADIWYVSVPLSCSGQSGVAG